MSTETAQPSPRPARTGSVALGLLIMGLVLLFLTMFLLSSAIRESRTQLVVEMENLQLTLDAPASISEQEALLNDQRAALINQINRLAEGEQQVLGLHRDFPRMMAVLLDFPPETLTLTQVGLRDQQVVIAGETDSETFVMDYVARLRAYPMFQTVTVSSLTINPESLRQPAAVSETPQPPTRRFLFTIEIQWSEGVMTPVPTEAA